MNYSINEIPKRTEKPRQAGITMVMDRVMAMVLATVPVTWMVALTLV